MEIEHRTLEVNNHPFHIATAGEGPLVLLAHGFPELWYCWRHQIMALAEAGYRVVAPDMRGYGDSYSPQEIEKYTMFHLVGDLVGIVHALGEEKAHLIGHDWGAGVSWNAAAMRPDIFHTVTCISVPYQPRHPAKQPVPTFRDIGQRKGLGEFYIIRFQEVGGPESEYEADLDHTFRLVARSASAAAAPEERFHPFLKPGEPLVRDIKVELPGWLTEEDHNIFVNAYRKSGFRGPLNWYRNMDLNWELMAAWQGARILQPCLYITGADDHVRLWSGHAEGRMPELLPGLSEMVIVPNAGHWVHQEAPDAVNAALLRFLRSVTP